MARVLTRPALGALALSCAAPSGPALEGGVVELHRPAPPAAGVPQESDHPAHARPSGPSGAPELPGTCPSGGEPCETPGTTICLAGPTVRRWYCDPATLTWVEDHPAVEGCDPRCHP